MESLQNLSQVGSPASRRERSDSLRSSPLCIPVASRPHPCRPKEPRAEAQLQRPLKVRVKFGSLPLVHSSSPMQHHCALVPSVGQRPPPENLHVTPCHPGFGIAQHQFSATLRKLKRAVIERPPITDDAVTLAVLPNLVPPRQRTSNGLPSATPNPTLQRRRESLEQIRPGVMKPPARRDDDIDLDLTQRSLEQGHPTEEIPRTAEARMQHTIEIQKQAFSIRHRCGPVINVRPGVHVSAEMVGLAAEPDHSEPVSPVPAARRRTRNVQRYALRNLLQNALRGPRRHRQPCEYCSGRQIVGVPVPYSRTTRGLGVPGPNTPFGLGPNRFAPG